MISLAHKTIFVHIPKCGGQSVEAAFLADFGLRWKRHRHLLMCRAKHSPDEPGRDNRLAHLRAAEYRDHYLPPKVFRSFYRFALVRDPYARAQSLYAYTGAAEEVSFEAYVLSRLPRLAERNPFMAPQAEFLCDADGRVLVDDMFRLEDIASAWAQVQARAGVESALPHRNKSGKPTHTWSAEMRAAVEQTYSADFALLGYGVRPPTH